MNVSPTRELEKYVRRKVPRFSLVDMAGTQDFLEKQIGRNVDVVTREGLDPVVRPILEAVANIEADTAGYDFEKFRTDRRARQLVERNLEILSEASRRLPVGFYPRRQSCSG